MGHAADRFEPQADALSDAIEFVRSGRDRPAAGRRRHAESSVPVTANPNRQYYRAVWERQKFAEDIYARLVHATGADITATPSTNPAAFNARRYLAQLAVNIVDYLDDDEFSTPFPWFTNPATGIPEYVYGVESPKVSLNEVYSEIKNTPGDTDTLNGATQPFLVHFWLELFNTHMDANLPTPTQNNDPVTTVNRGYAKLETGIGPGGATKNPAYRIRVYQESAPPDILRKLDNRIRRPRGSRHHAHEEIRTHSVDDQPEIGLEQYARRGSIADPRQRRHVGLPRSR